MTNLDSLATLQEDLMMLAFAAILLVTLLPFLLATLKLLAAAGRP